jgi:hypothetical protein
MKVAETCANIPRIWGQILRPTEGCMIMPSTHEITELLRAWSRGDDQALDKLTPLVYEELHRAAKRCISRERCGHTLQTTALINELYLRMIDLRQVSW